MQTLFRPEAVREKRQSLQGSLILAQPVRMYVVAICTGLLFVVAIVYFSSFEYKRTEAVSGFVTSSAGVVSLAARHGGILRQRYVNAGDSVQPGQALFESSTDTDTASGRYSEGLLATTELRLNEIRRQVDITTRTYENQHDAIQRQKKGLRVQAEHVAAQLRSSKGIAAVAGENLKNTRALRENNFASDNDVNRQAELALSYQSDIAGLQAKATELQSEIELLDIELRRLPDRYAQDISELTIRQNGLRETQLEQQAKTSYVVRAPVAGRVSAVLGSPGQQLRPNAPVVTLVPDDAGLVVHLLAPSRTIGLVAPGDDVELKIHAFPYQKFGLLPGTVSNISQSPFYPGDWLTPNRYDEPVYKIEVAIERDYVVAYGEQRPLMIGMTLAGDIVVDRRSLIGWILDPLLSIRS